MEKLTFMTDDNDSVELYIIEETRANGVNYLLVTDSDDEEDGDAQCYILKIHQPQKMQKQRMSSWKMIQNLML